MTDKLPEINPYVVDRPGGMTSPDYKRSKSRMYSGNKIVDFLIGFFGYLGVLIFVLPLTIEWMMVYNLVIPLAFISIITIAPIIYFFVTRRLLIAVGIISSFLIAASAGLLFLIWALNALSKMD